MLFILEILEFLKDPRDEIKEKLKVRTGKEIFIFPIAYGIFVWSDILKTSKVGDTSSAFGVLMNLIIIGALVGVALLYVYPYIITQVSKIFTPKGNYLDNKEVFAWCLSPFIIGALLIILEFFIGGKGLYSSSFPNDNNNLIFIKKFLSIIMFANVTISFYFTIIFTRTLAEVLQIKWWKSLIIIFISTSIIMFPLFLIKQ